MFRSLFGSSSDKPGPPKNQIEVVCPACGAAQHEPRLVVSTFCKKCGVHLSIHRKKVTASTVTRSGVGMPNPWAENKPSAPQPEPSPAASAPVAEAISAPSESPVQADPLAAEMQQPVSEEEAAEGGFGVFLKQHSTSALAPESSDSESAPEGSISPEKEAPTSPAKVEGSASNGPTSPKEELALDSEATGETNTAASEAESESSKTPVSTTTASNVADDDKPQSYLASRRPQSHSPTPTPAPAPMTASTLQKMKSEGMYRNQYFKDAECFECGHKYKVSRSTRSATCPSCSATIPLDDVEVNMHSGESIRTRGDVLIRKRGQVSAELIQCKDLRCQGILEANVKASGDAIFRATGTMIGEVRCRRFIVEKGADVVFLNEIHAEEVEVQAKITGTLFSSGPLVIGVNGSVNGDVTARSVSIEPGGELNGAMNIVRTQPAPKPVSEGS